MPSEFDRKSYMREWMRAWRIANPSTERARKKKYYEGNREKIRAYNARWRHKNSEKVAKQNERTKKRYLSAKIEIAGRAPDKCEICEQRDALHFDHCHVSGRFRGWLCFNCNAALGLVGDNPEILLRMLHYLRDNPDAVQIESSSRIFQYPQSGIGA